MEIKNGYDCEFVVNWLGFYFVFGVCFWWWCCSVWCVTSFVAGSFGAADFLFHHCN